MTVVADRFDEKAFSASGPPIRLVAPILVLAGLCFAAQLSGPLNHDVSWLLEAGTRWSHGQRLYVDVIELNPPLVFYVYGLVSAGTFARAAFTAGVVASIAVSSLWAARLNRERWAMATFLVCVACGILDFGQRDHLAAIVAIPYVWANRAGRGERAAIGAWSFLGFGLKPHLMLIPAGATLARMIQERSWRPAVAPENLVLGLFSIAYVAAALALYPAYFSDIVPLTRLVYFVYGRPFPGEALTAVMLCLCVAALIAGARERLWAETGALGGSIGSFLLQGRFWTYHLVPAVALALLVLMLILDRRSLRRRWWNVALAVLAALMVVPAARPDYPGHIPLGAKSVLFLSTDISAAYPEAFDRGVVNASPYSQLWTLPGAWRIVHDPSASETRRQSALAVLADTRRRVVDQLVQHCPDPIFVDEQPPTELFGGRFDFLAFFSADPRFTGYRPTGQADGFRVYRRDSPCVAATKSGQLE